MLVNYAYNLLSRDMKHPVNTAKKLKEASTHKSAKTHAGNVL